MATSRMNLSYVFGTIFCLCSVAASNRVERNTDKLIVTTINEPPYVKEKSPNSNDFEGFIPDMMERIAEELDLDYELRKVADGKYGQKDDNGQWNGMIGEVVSGKADMAAAPTTISEKRQESVDFTTPFMSIETTLLAKKPEDGGSPPFKNAEDLANQRTIKYGVVKHGMTENFFKTSTNPTYRKMWSAMQNDGVSSNTEGIKKVRNSDGKYVFIIESSTAEYWINREPCDLISVDKIDESTNHYGLVLPKGSTELKNRINTVIKKLKDNGEMTKLKDKWWKGDCNAATTVISLPTVLLSSLVLMVSKLV